MKDNDPTLEKFNRFLKTKFALDIRETSTLAICALENRKDDYLIKLMNRRVDLKHEQVNLKVLMRMLKHVKRYNRIKVGAIWRILRFGLHVYESP